LRRTAAFRDAELVEDIIMTKPEPLVSVSMLTYNHEKYVGEAIRSVLGQTFSDLELVIVDDGSTDATPRVIASFDDPRIVSIRQENQGPSAAANRAYQTCRGRYIALMSGDDVCHPDRVERQLEEYCRGERRLLFSAVDLIDDHGQPLTRPSPYDSVFDVRPKTRAEICHRFFHRGNFINAITCFTETEVLQKSGLCDPRLLQLQDFDLWVRLLKKFEIQFVPEVTLSYRIRGDNGNLSGPNPRNYLRHVNELYFVMRRFFDDLPPELFREAFRGELRRPACLSPVEIACEQAFLFVRSLSPVYNLIGIEKLHELLGDPAAAEVLQKGYQFDARAFIRLLGEKEAFNPLGPCLTTLYLDNGDGFSEAAAFRVMADPLDSQFTITFDLAHAPAVRQLRWDPVEGRLCRVRIEEIVWQAPNGTEGRIDLSTITANGILGDDGVYSFETTDPLLIFPYAGPLARLTVRGWWEVQAVMASLARFPPILAERDVLKAELADRHLELATQRGELAARQAELAAQQAELAAQRGELTELNQQLNAILTSRRWRIATKMHRIWRFLKRPRAA
jgi:glycosyltransferase involved in cell wall biosynthesis